MSKSNSRANTHANSQQSGAMEDALDRADDTLRNVGALSAAALAEVQRLADLALGLMHDGDDIPECAHPEAVIGILNSIRAHAQIVANDIDVIVVG